MSFASGVHLYRHHNARARHRKPLANADRPWYTNLRPLAIPVVAAYVVVCIVYTFIRALKSVDAIASPAYGKVVLAFEVLGMVSLLQAGINHLYKVPCLSMSSFRVQCPRSEALLVRSVQAGVHLFKICMFTYSNHPWTLHHMAAAQVDWTSQPFMTARDPKYRLRILVPCYKEDVEVLRKTLTRAVRALHEGAACIAEVTFPRLCGQCPSRPFQQEDSPRITLQPTTSIKIFQWLQQQHC